MKTRKRYTSEEKTKILRDMIDNNLMISQAAEKYELHPNMIYRWKKQMFEATPETLSNIKKKANKHVTQAEKRIAELEALIAKRESLIAELVEDNINLKKKAIGDNSTRNGSSRR